MVLRNAAKGACTRLKGANYRYNLTRVVSTGAFIDMDADEIRLLLKDQATAHQQQTEALQAQLAALQADLQSTKLLRIKVVGFNLEGDAAEWFRWMTRNKLISTCEGFVESVRNRFGSCKVTNISEDLLISFYISGLKPNLQRELLVSKPTSLGDAFSLARVTKARLEDQCTSSITTKATRSSSGTQYQRFTSAIQTPLLPTPTKTSVPPKSTVNPNNKPLAIKWISPVEQQEHLSKGLWFNCDNKWVRGHKCLGKFLLLMADDEDECESPADEAVKSGDIYILNSLVGHGSPRSLQLWGTLGIGGGQVHVLIDNGSTHNFVQPGIVERMGLPITTTKPFKVYTGSGESLLCESLCLQFSLQIQRVRIDVDLYVPPMKGPDVVLGIQWLQHLGKVTHYYAHQSMEFTVGNKTYTLKGEESLRMKQMSFNHLRELLESDEVYGIYKAYNLAAEEERPINTHVVVASEHSEITQLLAHFDHSPFSSPMLLVKKKDGSYRFCVDYRALNAVTVKDKFLIPMADGMFDELGGATIFTKLDLRAGYHQIHVHERNVYKTAFRTHDAHYVFLVMPFGLTNAASTFQATMNRLFSPYLRKFVIVFFDDILIYSASLAAYLEHLQCVFKCLQDNTFYVNQSKCVFGATTVEYLGHIISGRGVEMDHKKITAIVDWPTPKTQRQANASSKGIGAVLLQQGRPLRRRFTIRMDHKSIKELMQQVILMPLQQKYVRKLLGFDFLIEYKPGVSNQVADALSRMYEEDEGIIASFSDMSQPLVELINDLKQENETAEELRQLHGKLDREERLEGFRRKQGLLLYRDRNRRVVSASTYASGSLGRRVHGFYYRVACFQRIDSFFVVVDRFSKYAHFETLPTSFNVPKVAELFIEIVVKHYGFPKIIVSGRDPIFVSKFWKHLFEASGTQLNHSMAYHPQTDGQTEVVNRGLEQYLRAMVSDQSQHWVRLLPWAKFSYNTTFHSSIKMTQYQALYGWLPPSVIPYSPGSSIAANIDELLVERDALLRQLKHNLIAAKHRMEMKANRKRRDVEFTPGDRVLAKLQPYRQITVAKRLYNKLAKHYYGPFEVLERVGKVAYRLALTSKIHPVFHVSILKPFSGIGHEVVTDLPEEAHEGQPMLAAFGDLSPEEATWEWVSEFQATYPSYHLEDKVIVKGEENDTSMLLKRPNPNPWLLKRLDPNGSLLFPVGNKIMSWDNYLVFIN
uniref:Reverse transcriptase n=1 Tax=Tanacetum cinerariifolium TaxID=118510 RepID=A0A6L2NNM2_TANCI|nr:reverse transcriptase [Tanacetum cinerariifolium]